MGTSARHEIPSLNTLPLGDVLNRFDESPNHFNALKISDNDLTYRSTVRKEGSVLNRPPSVTPRPESRLTPPPSSPNSSTAYSPSPRSTVGIPLICGSNTASHLPNTSATSPGRASLSTRCINCNLLHWIDISVSSDPGDRSTPVRHDQAPLDQPPGESLPRVGAASVPPEREQSAQETTDKVRCSGVTNSGERCKRMMKVQPSLEPPEDVYCYQHIGKILRPLESYHSVAKKTITFSDWIPDYLQESTKGALRSEMVRPLSESEADGQMYCIKLRDAKQPPDVIQLKVGRTTNVNRRTDQWAKSCGSKTHILLGFYPEGNGDNVGMLPGRITTDRKVKNTHKLERLILLELADLATNQPYLSEDFICNSDDEGKTVKNEVGEMPLKSKTPQTRRSKTQQPAQAPCDDCGAVHREVFTFVRPQDGPLKGQEWEKIVRPVIKRWAKFVETYT